MRSRRSTTRGAGILPQRAAFLGPPPRRPSCCGYRQSKPPTPSAWRRVKRPAWWKICRVGQKISGSAMRPAMDSLLPSWRRGAIPGHQRLWKGRMAGHVPAVTRCSRSGLWPELGVQWEASKNTFKPYPCGIVMHAVIDACFALREQYHVTTAQIAAVRVRGDALLLARGDRLVRNAREARVSIQHCVAAAFLWGKAGVDEFAE